MQYVARGLVLDIKIWENIVIIYYNKGLSVLQNKMKLLTLQTYIYNSFFGLCHIGDDSICDDQEDIILGAVRNLSSGTKNNKGQEKAIRTPNNIKLK